MTLTRQEQLAVILGTIFVVSCLILIGVRLNSVTQDYLYAQSSGGEATALYGIYKIWNHEPIYTSLNENPSVYPYNYLFYQTYGLLSRLFSKELAAIPLLCKLLTFGLFLFLSVFLICYFYFLLASHRDALSDKKGVIFWALVCLSLTTALGPFIGWWALTTRPDMIASILEMIGLMVYLCPVRRVNKTVTTGVILWLAWSMKQANVSVFFGILFSMLMQKKWRDAFILFIPYSTLIVLTLAGLGKNYLFHTFYVNSIQPWYFQNAFKVSLMTFLKGSYVYLPALWIVIHSLKTLDKSSGEVRRLLLTAFIVSLSINVITSSKIGSGTNYFFTSYLVGMLVIGHLPVLGPFPRREASLNFFVKQASLGFLIGIVLTGIYFVFPNKIGRLTLIDRDQKSSILFVQQAIQNAKRPSFVEPAYYALPWFSQYDPSMVWDGLIHPILAERNLILSFQEKIKSNYYKEAFVSSTGFITLFRDLGYREERLTDGRFHFKINDSR